MNHHILWKCQSMTIDPCLKNQQGSSLLSVLLLVVTIGVMSTSMLDMSSETQQVSSSAIHRDRVFQSIDSALQFAERDLMERTKTRVFADANATEGVFSRGALDRQWWKTQEPEKIRNWQLIWYLE